LFWRGKSIFNFRPPAPSPQNNVGKVGLLWMTQHQKWGWGGGGRQKHPVLAKVQSASRLLIRIVATNILLYPLQLFVPVGGCLMWWKTPTQSTVTSWERICARGTWQEMTAWTQTRIFWVLPAPKNKSLLPSIYWQSHSCGLGSMIWKVKANGPGVTGIVTYPLE